MRKMLLHMLLSAMAFAVLFAGISAWHPSTAIRQREVPLIEQLADDEGPELGLSFTPCLMWQGIADEPGATSSGGRAYEASDGKRVSTAEHGFGRADDAWLAFHSRLHYSDEVVAKAQADDGAGDTQRSWAMLHRTGATGPVYVYLVLRGTELWEVCAPSRRHLWEFLRADGDMLTSPQVQHSTDGNLQAVSR